MLYKYNNNTITDVYTSTQINVKNYVRPSISCFTHQGNDYFQIVSNSTYNTLVFYNLTTHGTSIIRYENSNWGHVGGVVNDVIDSYIYYTLMPCNTSATYATRVNKSPNINITNSYTTVSNTISDFSKASNYIFNYPTINGKNKILFLPKEWTYYKMKYSNDYTQISYERLGNPLSNNYDIANIIFELNSNNGYDCWYLNTSYNIVRLQNAFDLS